MRCYKEILDTVLLPRVLVSRAFSLNYNPQVTELLQFSIFLHDTTSFFNYPLQTPFPIATLVC